MWIHESDITANPKKPRNEGKRFTVLHAGCVDGFLEGCLDLFQKWVEQQLIPALNKLGNTRKCVVVMHNAPYHSVKLDKRPNSNSK
jgi:hypothetical protein